MSNSAHLASVASLRTQYLSRTIPGTSIQGNIVALHRPPAACHQPSYVMPGAGHCLNPVLRDGDRILVETVEPDPGDIAVIHFRNGTSFIKRWGSCNEADWRSRGLVEFLQLNPPLRFIANAREIEALHKASYVRRFGQWRSIANLLRADAQNRRGPIYELRAWSPCLRMERVS